MALDECGRGANPLVNVGHITFTLSEAARVTIAVENSSGSIVTHRETDMRMTATSQSFAYYALNDASKRVAAGNYTVVISAKTQRGTRRL